MTRRRWGSVALLVAAALGPAPAGVHAAATEPSPATTVPTSATTVPATALVPTTTEPAPVPAPAVEQEESSLAVGTEAEYRAALVALSADPSGPHRIDLTADIEVDDGSDPTYSGDRPLTIAGHGFTLDAGGTGRLLVVDGPADARVRLVGVTMRNGVAVGDGGAVLIRNGSVIEIVDSRFEANRASGSGGAVEAAAEALVIRSDFTGNEASGGDGGALDATTPTGRFVIRQSQFQANRAPAGEGGAVSAIGFPQLATGKGVERSTFLDNVARRGGAVVLGGNAGIDNSTIVDNRATEAGGGLLTTGSGYKAVLYLTLTGNTAPQGANIAQEGTPLWLFFSVMAAPVGGDNCDLASGVLDIAVHAYSDDASCAPVDQGGDPMLGPLADNGGRTSTRLPLPGSPLIDAVPRNYGYPAIPGTCADTQGLDPWDQRGVRRPQDGDGETRPANYPWTEVADDCDIGAVEVAAALPPDPVGPVPARPGFTG